MPCRTVLQHGGQDAASASVLPGPHPLRSHHQLRNKWLRWAGSAAFVSRLGFDLAVSAGSCCSSTCGCPCPCATAPGCMDTTHTKPKTHTMTILTPFCSSHRTISVNSGALRQCFNRRAWSPCGCICHGAHFSHPREVLSGMRNGTRTRRSWTRASCQPFMQLWWCCQQRQRLCGLAHIEKRCHIGALITTRPVWRC